jgi:hypothetical protein
MCTKHQALVGDMVAPVVLVGSPVSKKWLDPASFAHTYTCAEGHAAPDHTQLQHRYTPTRQLHLQHQHKEKDAPAQLLLTGPAWPFSKTFTCCRILCHVATTKEIDEYICASSMQQGRQLHVMRWQRTCSALRLKMTVARAAHVSPESHACLRCRQSSRDTNKVT